MQRFEEMLSGGHPNSLGRTVEVVEAVLSDPTRLVDLFACYHSQDEVVRLRVSNALKRIQAEKPEYLWPWVDHLLDEISQISQPSTYWTMAQLFRAMRGKLNDSQYAKIKAVLIRNLEGCDDWIVQTQTMETLAIWSKVDAELAAWLRPYLQSRVDDARKSVSGKAAKLLKTF